MIPISKVNFSKEEESAVLEVLRSGNLVQGEKVEEFERQFAKYIGTKYAIAVSNGTTALHLALLVIDLKSGDEVITTPFTFIAPTNAIFYVGAKPVFVDVGDDFNIDTSKIEEKITDRTKAILPVHLFGNPCDMDEILSLSRKHNLKVIEDAAQAHGAEYEGKKVGSIGDMGCFSFYATKNMTTGEGGMITTNNPEFYEKVKMLRSHGSKTRYFHKFLGFNYRMTDIQAAIGLIQLKKLDKLNETRIKNAEYLTDKLKDVQGVIAPKTDSEKKHVFHQYTLILTDRLEGRREKFVDALNAKGIDCGIYYPVPVHKQEELIEMGVIEDLPNTEKLSYNVISIPIHPGLSKSDLDFIAKAIRELK